jgi:hypothetical protein|tara:strand:- start:209 stop:679 length:471 start_codon:yes stop_codon:yes gene_type:complete
MAFKMNREGFTFYTKPDKGPTMRDKGYPKYSEHDKGLTKTMENKGYPKVKPDYIDIDGDGNKTESMKDAAASKKGFSKTPYEKNRYSSSMPKHKAGHEETTPQTVNPDKKRKQSIINKLKTLKDPVDSSEGKRLTNILIKDYNMSADGIESEVGFR